VKSYFKSLGEEETISLGRKLGGQFPPNTVVCLFGDLGAGKTTLVKGIVEGVTGDIGGDEVCSPTFIYLNVYDGEIPVYHFDLYRMHGPEDFIGMGFDEYFDAGGVTCMEWSERIEDILPARRINITLKHSGEGCRTIEVEGVGCEQTLHI
jgi:tRNA threonylcarbamoyladenosine biosynthesis protein TsaE